MHKILLIEDAAEYQLLISRALGTEMAEVTVAGNYQSAMQVIEKTEFDLILLDIGLPDEDGFTICRDLQASEKTAHIPVIFITGKSSANDIVAGFSIGADDYISKPFDPMILKARIESRLKKMKSAKTKEEVVNAGDLHANIPQMKAYLSLEGMKKDLMLTPIEFRLLYQLMKIPERVLSREQLLALVWGENVHVYDRTVDVHISSLRRKLGSHAFTIQSVLNAGYRFSLTTKSKSKVAA